jgi:hypothetical protein
MMRRWRGSKKAFGQRVMRVTEPGMRFFDDLRNESGFAKLQLDKLTHVPHPRPI